MKHSIALIFSMVAPHLLDINFINLERKTVFKKSNLTSKYAPAAKLQKNTPSCGEKMAPSNTVFKKIFFWEWKEVFSKYVHTKIQLYPATVKRRDSVTFHPYNFLLYWQKKKNEKHIFDI